MESRNQQPDSRIWNPESRNRIAESGIQIIDREKDRNNLQCTSAMSIKIIWEKLFCISKERGVTVMVSTACCH